MQSGTPSNAQAAAAASMPPATVPGAPMPVSFNALLDAQTMAAINADPELRTMLGISVGGEEELLADGDTIQDTQSSLVLEDLIGKFLLNSVNKD